MTHEYKVDAGAANQRLDVYLAQVAGRTRSQIQRLMRDGAVVVNGQTERPSYLVQTDDTIAVQEAHRTTPVVTAPELPVVYEDDELLVIDKPAGLAAHAGSGTIGQATVADFARLHTEDTDAERPGIVHRLDRDTSGLMVIAKTMTAKTALQQAFRDHEIRKTYTALVVGRLEPPAAMIDLPLDRDPARPLRRAVVTGGRPAKTRYETTGVYPGFTLIKAYPETGRTHQLRVHFAATGHPIAGDIIYGGPNRPVGLKRQFLHASGLDFVTPAGKTLSLSSPLPTDLHSFIATLDGDNDK